MENAEDIERVKEEPNDTFPDAGDDYNFNLVESCKAENVDTSTICESLANHMNETMGLPEQLDEKILIDVECKHVKPELSSLSKRICKIEHQNSQSIVKMEKKYQTNDTSQNIFTDVECKNVKLELKSSSTTICQNEYQITIMIIIVDLRLIIDYNLKNVRIGKY
ncbi:uncharacterized protein LOC106649039 [Trichogramma pretiosum]|uniref:uncharacterized protein LOC106649039 n=1 Tax=Trichogramma pretiosum TaxID=7493 RepID=UPI000C71C068|nr:uncharacterized protein LOC106649039 [Trichogramma pretiosum]